MNYVKTCVYVLITSMVFAVVLTYASTITIISNSKDNTERVLTGYVTENSKQIYQSIKNGHDYTPSLDADFFSSKYLLDGTLDYDGEHLYNYNSEGGYVYRLTLPQTSFAIENTLNLTCRYEIKIPIEFNGKEITELVIPIKVHKEYQLK